MSTEPERAIEKPSDRIETEMQQSLNAAIKAIFAAIGTEPTDEQIAIFREGPGGSEPTLQIAGLSCYIAAIKAELDREAERRAKWEETVEVRLNGLTIHSAAGLF